MLTSIEIKNFRGLESAKLENINGRLFVTGVNRAGKTPFLNAVQFGFSGVCYGQDDKRMQLTELITGGQKDCALAFGLDVAGEQLVLEVTLRKSGDKTLQQARVLRAKGGEVIVGTPDEVRAALWKRMGKDFSRAQAGLHPRAFLLSGEVLQHIAKLSGGIDQGLLAEACGEHFEWLSHFASARRLKLDSPEALKEVGKAAEAKRTEVNRNDKKLKTQLEGMNAVLPKGPHGEFTPDDLPALRDNLATLRRERDGLQRQLGAATGTHTQDEIDAAIAEAEAALAELKVPTVSVEELEKERMRVSGVHSEEKQVLSRLTDKKDTLTKQIGLIKSKSTCPTCNRAYKPAEITKLVTPLEEELGKVTALHAEKSPYVQSLLESLKPIDERLHDAREVWQGYTSEKNRWESKLAAMRSCAPRVDTSGIQADIAAIDARMSNGDAIIKAVELYQSVEEQRQQLVEYQAEIEHLNWAVAAFRDGDVTNQLTGDARAQFVDAVNEHLAKFGQSITIEGVDGQMAVYLLTQGKRIPLSSAGDSELLVVQLAVAEAFGQGLVVLDRLEQLDVDRKTAFFAALEDMRSDFVVAGVWGIGGADDIQEQVAGVVEYFGSVDVALVTAGTAELVVAEVSA